MSGVISGSGGSLNKIGTGTLILSGDNIYSGGTTIAGGTLQFGDGTSTNSNNLGGSVNVTGGTLAIQSPTALNVADTVTFGDNTALSIAAGANSPALSANSVAIGNNVAFNISGITDASQLDKVLIDTASGISGDFARLNVGGFAGAVDYLTVSTRKSDDSLQYLASYGLAWNAGNNLADGTFTLTNTTDSFTVGTVLADQAANGATGWNGTALTKAGAGTLILTADNTYTGGTTISGGTLQIGNGGTTGSITGNVVNDSVLAFNRSDAMSFAGNISGSGAVQQIGSGTTILTGANTYTGGTTISGGTLIGNTTSLQGNILNNAALTFDQSSAGSFAGVISGTGALTKDGAGALTLTGANTYTGGTIITAGTLIGNTTSLQGNIANNAALIFDQIATGTYAGVISGSGSLTKAGAGELILTGNSSAYSGTTDIAAGLLAINGSLGGVINFSGGTLGGSGSLGNVTIASGGSIAPGNSIGTLNVANITMAAGSTYSVELNNGGFVAGTNNDLINATGTATINGGTVHVTPVNGTDTGTTYTPGTYTILTAAGGVTGTFTALTDDYAFLNFALGYDANNVTLTSTLAATSFCLAGMTTNQCATGDAAFSVNSGSLFNALLNLTAAEAPGALDQLSGEAHASFKTALIEDSRFIRNAVNDRIRAAFDAVGASGTVSTYDGGKPVTVKANTDRFAVWGQGFGSWGHTSSDGNAAHLNRKTGGFFIGADAPVFDTWRIGAVAGYSQTSFDVKDRRSFGSSDNYYVGLYGGTAWGDVAFRAGAAYTWHDVSTNRSVTFPGFGDSLKGDYNAATAQMFGELAYGFSAGSARVEPFANLAYVNLHTDGFTEQGGTAALTGASDNTDATFTTLGLRASTTFDVGGTTLTAKGMVGGRHAFGDTAPTSTMRFAGGGNAFTIGGVPIARDAAVIEAGLDYAITPNATLGLSYGGQFGSAMSDQSARFNFNVKF
ncbi:autotransporter domain-containing protein [Mesorhizobium sp. Cs1299R1N1]|uniref:autotransporter domain-containing protein n=1 Tax=Mesorhizobium sp. Cs1299R1N1 TaxID=3015172 RepID=UPI00301C1271